MIQEIKKIRLLLLFTCLLIFGLQKSYAQESKKEFKWDIKLSNSYQSEAHFKNFRLEGNYSFLRSCEVGAYFGYSKGYDMSNNVQYLSENLLTKYALHDEIDERDEMRFAR